MPETSRDDPVPAQAVSSFPANERIHTHHPMRKSDPSRRGPVPLEVRIRARASYASRLHELERIIDGTSIQTIVKTEPNGGKSTTTITPNPKEKILALQELAKLGKVHDSEGEAILASEEQIARALEAVLREPALRAYLISSLPNAFGMADPDTKG